MEILNYYRMDFIPSFISGSEIIIIFIVVLLLFGADKIPEIARTLGKGMREFRKVTNDLKREFNDSTTGIREEVEDLKKDMDKTKDDLSGEIRKYVDPGRSAPASLILLANGDTVKEIDCLDQTGLPFFGELILDVLNGTENSMTQEHIFKAAELSMEAQLLADEQSTW
ncbi:MAG: twin-arginine translocase TatA/TatE family subunit [Pseudohongiellaceae bacterium]